MSNKRSILIVGPKKYEDYRMTETRQEIRSANDNQNCKSNLVGTVHVRCLVLIKLSLTVYM